MTEPRTQHSANASVDRRNLLGSVATVVGAGLAGSAIAQRGPRPAPHLAAFDTDAVATAASIRFGSLTSVQAVAAAIARAEVAEPQINAFVTRTFDLARTRSQEPIIAGLLGGVPSAIKDLDAAAGVRLRRGSRSVDVVPERDSPFVAQLKAGTGLVSLGKSATPEFGLTASTEPVVSGPCRNPWNPDHIPGGSSGGAAALVAAGVIPVAHASDGGGSIRIPAACCGLVGLKPSRGRLEAPQSYPDGIMDLGVDGCVSRTVRDTAAFLAALETSGQGLPRMGLVSDPIRRRLDIAWYAGAFTDIAVDPEVAATVENTARLLRQAGHRVTEYRPMIGGRAFADAFMLLWSAGAAQTVRGWMERNPGRQPGPDVFEVWTLYLAGKFQAQEHLFPAAIRTLNQFADGYERILLPRFDVILTPTTATPAPRIGALSPMMPGPEHERAVLGLAAYTPFQNVSGAPAISLPMGMSSSGLPIGVQIAGKLGEDRTLLELAYQLEQIAPWHGRKPKVWTL